jgi:hypothetical protein
MELSGIQSSRAHCIVELFFVTILSCFADQVTITIISTVQSRKPGVELVGFLLVTLIPGLASHSCHHRVHLSIPQGIFRDKITSTDKNSKDMGFSPKCFEDMTNTNFCLNKLSQFHCVYPLKSKKCR